MRSVVLDGAISVATPIGTNNLGLDNATGRFLPHGSIAYAVSGKELELLTNPAAGVPVVLVKVG